MRNAGIQVMILVTIAVFAYSQNSVSGHTETPEGNVVYISATQHKHGPLALSADALRVLDNKGNSARIVNVRSMTQIPLRLCLLIDTSGSMRPYWPVIASMKEPRSFFQALATFSDAKISVITFSTTIQDREFMNAADLAQQQLNLNIGGGTALYDALAVAANRLSQTESSARRVIMILSDGEDSESHITQSEAAARIQAVGATIIAIGMIDTNRHAPGEAVLKDFAKSTGGQALFPTSRGTLEKSFQNVQTELGEYALTFQPEPSFDLGSFKIESTNSSIKIRESSSMFGNPVN